MRSIMALVLFSLLFSLDITSHAKTPDGRHRPRRQYAIVTNILDYAMRIVRPWIAIQKKVT